MVDVEGTEVGGLRNSEKTKPSTLSVCNVQF